jgi:hypothetical protein
VTRRVWLAALLAGAIFVPLSVHSQVARDLRKEPIGTGAIGGAVVADDESARPLRLASVTLAGDALLNSRLIATDGSGHFDFNNLPAGQYTLQAYRSGYLRMNYGAKSPETPGISIVLADDQRLANLTIRLPQMAAITGTILDQNGEPAEGVSVEALAYTMRTGIRTLASVYGAAQSTDDRGIYRYGGLTPGDYLIVAGPSRALGGIRALAASDIDRALAAIASGGVASAVEGPSGAGGEVTYAPVYFPGTTDLTSATTISLKAGEERGGVDLRLALVPCATIEGTITMPDGRPAPDVPVTATVVGIPNSIDLFRVGDPGTVRSDARGHFRFTAVPPGQYEITARLGLTGAEVFRSIAQTGGTGPGPGAPQTTTPSWARSTVIVDGGDQTVSLRFEPGVTVAGRVVFDGTTLKPPPDLSVVRVRLAVPGYGTSVGATVADAAADGTFRIAGVAPGQFRIAAAVPGATSTAGWALRSAMMNGVDAADAPIDVRGGQDLTYIVLTFTDHPSLLSGTVQTPAGVAASDFYIIIFATDRAQWGAQSRRTVMVRPTTLGRYMVRNLPPGDYYLAAVTDVSLNQWFDPGFLDSLVPAAIRVTIAEGEQATRDVRIGG